MRKRVIADGEPLTIAQQSLRVECPKCLAPRGHPCLGMGGRAKRPCTPRWHLATGYKPRGAKPSAPRSIQRDLFALEEGGDQ